jgi:hypothetical protein
LGLAPRCGQEGQASVRCVPKSYEALAVRPRQPSLGHFGSAAGPRRKTSPPASEQQQHRALTVFLKPRSATRARRVHGRDGTHKFVGSVSRSPFLKIVSKGSQPPDRVAQAIARSRYAPDAGLMTLFEDLRKSATRVCPVASPGQGRTDWSRYIVSN